MSGLRGWCIAEGVIAGLCSLTQKLIAGMMSSRAAVVLPCALKPMAPCMLPCSQVYSGGLGSYALLVMVAAFLQLHPLRAPAGAFLCPLCCAALRCSHPAAPRWRRLLGL